MKKALFIVLLCVLVFTSVSVMNAEEIEGPTEGFYTGLAEMTDEELEAFHNTLPRIVDVKPNSIALSRLSEDESLLLENVEVAELGEEMVYAVPGEETSLMSTTIEFPLTDAVDVSESPTFPPIGDQGSTNSCLPWALCYYQLTNNTCVVRGLHAKTEAGEVVSENVMAPGFIYSLVNGGTDSGSNFYEVCHNLAGFGCPTINKHDLEITAENLKRLNPDTNVWHEAIYNKPKVITYIPKPTDDVVNVETNSLVQVKKILSNGYVVTFSTRIAAWNFTNTTTTEEYACSYMKNVQEAGHAMTIVGYDDNFWIDINDNGNRDDGEFGAFKVVNSWGYESSLFPQGFAWIAYDALGNESGVLNAPEDRISAMKEDFYVLIPWKNYTPLLVAEIEITASCREYICTTFSVSCENDPEYFSPILVNEVVSTIFYSWKDSMTPDKEAISFSGATGEETIIVPFDLTSIISDRFGTIAPGTSLRVYISVEDGNSKDSLSVSYGNVKIIEPISGKTVEYSGGEQFISYFQNPVKYIDFEITPFVGYNKGQNITLEFNSSIQEKSVSGNIYLVSSGDVMFCPKYEVIDNKIVIYAPGAGYDFNTNYKLYITDGVITKGGNRLKHNREILIYILTEATEINIPIPRGVF